MASKIAAHFRRSTAAAAAVGRLVTHVKTRFNSYLLCVESIFKHFSKLKSHLAVLPAGEDDLKNYVEDFEIVLPQALAATTLMRLFAITGAELTSDGLCSHLTLPSLQFLYQKLQIDDTRARAEFNIEKNRFLFLTSFPERKKQSYITHLKSFSQILSTTLKSRYFSIFYFFLFYFNLSFFF